jgi:aminopeptidase N
MVSDDIRRQDMSYWLAYSFMNRHARIASWKWMQKNWNWLQENLGTDMSFSRMPIYAARTFSDQKLITEYTEFFADKITPTIERSYNQGLEMAQTATAWRQRDSESAHQWFSKNN